MLVKLLAILLLTAGCSSLLPFFKNAPFEIKASIEGDIKGHHIRCEKVLKLAEGKWALMCGVGNDMDVKYRVRSITDGEAQVEFLISRDKEGEQKIIATPTVFIRSAKNVQNITTTARANIVVNIERIK